MNKIESNHLRRKLKKLEKFTQEKEEFTENEIIDWISDCVTIFTEIGVNRVVIDDFLNFFSFGSKEILNDKVSIPGREKDIMTVKTLGPFEEKIGYSCTSSRTHKASVSCGCYNLQGNFYYGKIAFSCAMGILKKDVDEKKIVPSWLIEELSGRKECSHVVSSLKLIEIAYTNKNPEELTTNAATLLDSFLSFDAELKTKTKLSGKLNSLQEDKAKLAKYGISKDIVLALNNSRVIRNEKIVHKNIPLKYDLPFAVATSFAYLSLFFMEALILNGEILKD